MIILSMSDIVRHIGKDVKIGENVQIWNFSYIGNEAEIGDNTKIGSLVHIDYGVKIGKNCKVEGMAYIPPLTVIGNGVFLGPGVIFTNDPYPMSEKMVGVTVKDDAIVCAGAMLKAGITVGARAVIGMGAVVTKDVPSDTLVYGSPAREGYPIEQYIEKRKEWNIE
jgi:UDP-2-acetamido-3-amino-2,3-dideoxy-glucuronate N-acetyltransferase